MKLPQLNPRDIQRAIRILEGLDPKTTSICEYEAHLEPLFRGYTVVAPRFEAGINIYRARKCQRPTSLSDISYPPTGAVTALGRANDIGQSMFYGTTARGVPFFELSAQPGDDIALSKWRTTGPIMLNHIGFSSEPETFRDAKRKLDTIYKFVEGTRAISDLNSLVHDYLAYIFSRSYKEEHNEHYKLTNAIGRKLFSDDIFDGLLYPTVRMFGNADNIAIKPDAVDRLLRFVSVEYVVVKAARGTEFDIEILDSASRADMIGTLMWSGRKLQWKLRKQGELLTVVREGEGWVAYDVCGRRVDPE